jgi:hypothetical protein
VIARLDVKYAGLVGVEVVVGSRVAVERVMSPGSWAALRVTVIELGLNMLVPIAEGRELRVNDRV